MSAAIGFSGLPGPQVPHGPPGPPLSLLAWVGFSLFAGNHISIARLYREIGAIINYVPAKYHLIEFNDIGLWDAFALAFEAESESNGVELALAIVQFNDLLNAALCEHHQEVGDQFLILSPAFVVRVGIAETCSPGMIRAEDEVYVGLIARYTMPNSALWSALFMAHSIRPTRELLWGLSIVRICMMPLRDLRVHVVKHDYGNMAITAWERGKELCDLVF